MSKRETIEEFLARGGTITKCDPAPPPDEDKQQTAVSTSSSSGIMSLAEGSQFYAEIKPKVSKKKKPVTINFSALPPALLKFVKNQTQEE